MSIRITEVRVGSEETLDGIRQQITVIEIREADRGLPIEVDSDYVHPAVRERLSRWAGQSSNAEAMGILEALAVDEEMVPDPVRRRIQRALGLLR